MNIIRTYIQQGMFLLALINSNIIYGQTYNTTINNARNVDVTGSVNIKHADKVTILKDSQHLLDRENIVVQVDTFQGMKGLIVYPKEGAWFRPFTVVPKIYKKRDGIGLFPTHPDIYQCNTNDNILTYRFKIYQVRTDIHQIPCTKDYTYFIPLDYEKCFFVFGDNIDKNKWYIYDFGDIHYYKEVFRD